VTDIVLVRHGETVWHAENRYAGRSDIALTERGYRQSAQLADWAATARLAALWVSPQSRARATAEPVARATGLQLRVDERLRELDFGQGEGRTIAEMEQLFPKALAAFRDDPVAHHLPDGEDPRLAAERAVACLGDIARAHPGDRVLVISHTTLIRLALCQLLGAPLCRYRSLFPFLHNTAISEIRLYGDQVSLLQFNAPIAPRRRQAVASAPQPQTSVHPDRARRMA
jgi:broad specificity phosphatase PhoE